MSCFEACSASLLVWVWLHCLLLGKGQCGASPPRQDLWRAISASGQAFDIGQGILKDQWMDKFEWKQWKSALWTELTGLCGRGSSLSQGFLKRLLTVWNADKLWFHQPGVKLRKVHAEAETVFQQYNFWVLKEQGQHSQTLFFCCFISEGACKSPWFAVGLQCSTWEWAGPVLIQVWVIKAVGSLPLKWIRQQILLQEFSEKTVTDLYPHGVELGVQRGV